jgi:hypothetical protein
MSVHKCRAPSRVTNHPRVFSEPRTFPYVGWVDGSGDRVKVSRCVPRRTPFFRTSPEHTALGRLHVMSTAYSGRVRSWLTVRTTFPVFCPVSTYLFASTTSSNG